MLPRKADKTLTIYRADSLLKQFDDKDYFYVSLDEQKDMRDRLRAKVAEEKSLTIVEKGMLLQYMLDELVGFSILGPILRSKNVFGIQIFKDCSITIREQGVSKKSKEKFRSMDHLMFIVNRLIYPDKLVEDTAREYKLRDGFVLKVLAKSSSLKDPIFEIIDCRQT